MKKCSETNNFARWPFVPEKPREDGERNNGAFDLLANPEQIDLIHEATEDNGLRALIAQLNSSDGLFMTLGCASGQEGDFYYSYLELTFRNADVARDEQSITSLEDQWKVWVTEHCQKQPEFAAALLAAVVWEYREFSLRNAEPQYLVTVYSRTINAADHALLLTWIEGFFSSYEKNQSH